jgi:heme exporter protein A
MGLTVENLSCTRGGVVVLEGVTFTLAPGRAMLVRGPNGAGKTTLLRTLAGLQPPLAGRIGLPEGGCVYAAHADGVKATLSVAENLRFWAAIMGAGGIDAALAALDLAGLADRPAQTLSAGQRRRLGLARLVLGGPGALWLMDEPTVSLDAASVGLVERAVQAHLAGGGTALIATHLDLGLPGAGVFDLGRHRATGRPVAHDPFAMAIE